MLTQNVVAEELFKQRPVRSQTKQLRALRAKVRNDYFPVDIVFQMNGRLVYVTSIT